MQYKNEGFDYEALKKKTLEQFRSGAITDKVIPLVKEWQARALDSLYCMVWLDAMFYKVKEEGKVQTRCLYNILGITTEGKKEVLGMYVSESEGANFWLSVLTDLQNRGVEDILIASIDNLKGFDQAIATYFPKQKFKAALFTRYAIP